jgi:hypothetical protein
MFGLLQRPSSDESVVDEVNRNLKAWLVNENNLRVSKVVPCVSHEGRIRSLEPMKVIRKVMIIGVQITENDIPYKFVPMTVHMTPEDEIKLT